MELFGILIFGYLCLIYVMILISLIISDAYKDNLWVLPSHIYKKSKLNKFGCYMLFFILLIFNPIYTIGILIGSVIYWGTHTGRK